MRAAIVVDEQMPIGLLANTTACVISGLFHGEEHVLGDPIDGKDCRFIPITKIPILILKKGQKNFSELLNRAKTNNLKYMLFTKEAQSTTSYEEYISRVKGKAIDELTIVALGVIGEDTFVKKFGGDLALLR